MLKLFATAVSGYGMENTFKRENQFRTKSARAKSQRRAVTFSIYFGIILLLGVLVFNNYAGNIRAEENTPMHKSAVNANLNPVENSPETDEKSSEKTIISPEQVVAANLAATVATSSKLSSTGSVISQADSMKISSEIAQADTDKLDKNSVAEGDFVKVLLDYKVKPGDTVAKLAKQFGVSAQTIRWANDLTGDELAANANVTIPTVDGVVYTVQDEDRLEKIAKKYRSKESEILAMNNLSDGKLRVGAKILLPGGILPENERPTVAQSTAITPRNDFVSTPDTANVYRASIYAGNRYAYGNCTWYAYNRRAALGRPIGSFWGNANTWDESGIAAGFAVNKTPAPGAILQDNSGYYGHVAIVEKVNPNGSIVISEMNFGGGWGVVSSRTIVNWHPYNFIH